MKKFVEYKNLDLAEVNREVLEEWKKKDLFNESLKLREGCPSFVFYEGPPSANGMPGIHHVIARSIKDIFCRYKTMKGFLVKRKAGWDTHGLPVELGVEKKLGITKEDIGKKISVEEYNATCRREVMKFTKEWEQLTQKMGYWVDMNNPYITYDNRYIETLWWLLKQLYNKGYLYKGYTIQPYSPAAGTGLSTHELNQPGCYRDVKDTTCTALFKVDTSKRELNAHQWLNEENLYFVAWTTTPWTLPSNTALCVGEKIEYALVQTLNPYTGNPIKVIIAKERISAYFPQREGELSFEDYKIGDKSLPYKVLGYTLGKDLVGIYYHQLLPWVKPEGDAFRVISGDYVTTEDGTGIVHIAPTFGADDLRVAKAFSIPSLMLEDKDGNKRPMVDLTGKFFLLEDLDKDFAEKHIDKKLYSAYAGRYVKNAYDEKLTEKDITLDIDICLLLKSQGLLFKTEKHTHSYPHCWRTDKPVLYYPLDSWFIKTTACREKMMQLNATIQWKPSSTGTGRFGKWLENLQDWNLSRSRFWGTPLPIWRTEDGKEEICIGSVEELYDEIEKSIAKGFMKENPYKDFRVGDYSKENYNALELHRPYVDNIILVSPSGKEMKRETDLIDVWFDSGAMPYAQIHYPFENKEDFDQGRIFPADFIAEGVDQTRGWFFTLHAIASMVFGSVAYRNVVSNGLVLDKNGEKMSKHKGNVIDPFAVIEEQGSDPLRWYMITNASPWENLKFNLDGVRDTRGKFFGTLHNIYSFFALYANVDNFHAEEEEIPLEKRQEIDRWILSRLNSLIKEVDEYYNTYEPTRAGRAIQDFVCDHLSNWYVRLNRKRFWGGGYTEDKLVAYQTLFTCLEVVARLMSPIAPLYADKLYRDLMGVKREVVSVHLEDFPSCKEEFIDPSLEERMELAQNLSSMVLGLRKRVGIKVRQPLQTILVPVTDNTQKRNIESIKSLVLSEVNVKELKLVEDTTGISLKKIKPNFKKLGPKCGKSMKELAKEILSISQEEIHRFEKEGQYAFHINGEEIMVSTEDVEIVSEDIEGWLVANEGNLTTALDTTITPELRYEGIARELVNRIQNMRKAKGLEITDRILVSIACNQEEELKEVIRSFGAFLSEQVLADEIQVSKEMHTENAFLINDVNYEVEIENKKI